jgi:hypothetical protein
MNFHVMLNDWKYCIVFALLSSARNANAVWVHMQLERKTHNISSLLFPLNMAVP